MSGAYRQLSCNSIVADIPDHFGPGSAFWGDARGTVPKRDLMAELQVLMEHGQLKIGNLTESERLVRELTDVKMSFAGGGRLRMGADGYGEHDDLVIALALACWRAKRRLRPNGEGTRRLPGI